MRKNALIRNTATAVFLGGLLYLTYLFFHGLIFKYVAELEDIGFLLIERLVSTGFLAFFFMLVISSLITSFTMMFRSPETEYLFSSPLGVLQLFTMKYIDVVILSSWSILIMAAPILYSYARVRQFGAVEYALTGILVLLPFTLTATSIGSIMAILAVHASNRIRLRTLFIGGIFIFAGFLFLLIRFAQPTQMVIPFTEDFRALNIFINNFRLNSHPLTPNFWLIQSLRALVLNDYREFILYATALFSSALFSLTLLYAVAERLYFPTWLIANEARNKALSVPRESVPVISRFLTGPPQTQIGALMAKDAVMFVRDPSQWTQMLMIGALVTVYFVNLHFIPEDIELEQWRTILSMMNFAFCGFVLATFSVRFVYPSISLEGDARWVLDTGPVSPATILREKFITAFGVFILIGELLALISGAMLSIEPLYQLLTVIGIVMMSISLASLAIGFGAAYPDYSSRNPSEISSSSGGILTIVCSFIYIALMLVLLVIPSYSYTVYLVRGGEFPLFAIFISTILAVALNLFTVSFPLIVGMRSFERREY